MKYLLYSFPSFKSLHKLENVFVFKKLKKDFECFKNLIIEQQPEYIIGLANSDRYYSTIEKFAINKFNKGVINKEGKDQYELYASFNFKTKPPTSTFCNWTMYKIAEFIDERKLSSRQIFIHLYKDDFRKLRGYVNKLNS